MVLCIVFVVPLAFVFATMVIAKERSNVAIMWFFIGLFLGPFGLLAVLLTSRKKMCMQCKKRIEKDALKCAYCGSVQ
jgi:hypothetical protein